MDIIAKSCNMMWVLNPHATEGFEWVRQLSKRGLIKTIDITPDLIKFGAKEFEFEDYVVITPDEGGQERFAVTGFGKDRSNSYVIELHGDLDVKGKNVIVVDDLTKSGNTLLKAAERALNQGAADVGLAVAHVLPLRDKGEELLEKLVKKCKGKIVTSNSVNTNIFCTKNPNLTCNVVDTIVKVL